MSNLKIKPKKKGEVENDSFWNTLLKKEIREYETMESIPDASIPIPNHPYYNGSPIIYNNQVPIPPNYKSFDDYYKDYKAYLNKYNETTEEIKFIPKTPSSEEIAQIREKIGGLDPYTLHRKYRKSNENMGLRFVEKVAGTTTISDLNNPGNFTDDYIGSNDDFDMDLGTVKEYVNSIKKNKLNIKGVFEKLYPRDYACMILKNNGIFYPAIMLTFNYNSEYFINLQDERTFMDKFISNHKYFLIYDIVNSEYKIINIMNEKNIIDIKYTINAVNNFYDFKSVPNGNVLIPKFECDHYGTYNMRLYLDEIYYEYGSGYTKSILKDNVIELLNNFILPEFKIIKVGDTVSFKTDKEVNSKGLLIEKNISHSPNLWIVKDELDNQHIVNKKFVKKINNEKQDISKVETPLSF